MDFKYNNPVERLDEFIDKMSRGIMPATVDDVTMKEIELRMKELSIDGDVDDYDEDEIAELESDVKKLQERAQDSKRKATRDKVVAIFTLTDEQKKQLREDMETSYVRAEVSSYNTPEDVVNEDKERQVLMKRASRIRRCYYRTDEWKAAMQTILDIVDYDSRNYPWMTKKEYYSAFWKGTIKLNVIVPVLFIDYHTPIKDPKMLTSIFKGETIVEKQPTIDTSNRVRVKDDSAVYMDAISISKTESDYMQTLAASGYDTPLNLIIKESRKSVYDRFLPVSKKTTKNAGEVKELLKQYRLFTMIPLKTTDVVAFIHKQNPDRLNASLSSATTKFLTLLQNKNEVKVDTSFASNDVLVNAEAAMKEATILATIKSLNQNTKF